MCPLDYTAVAVIGKVDHTSWVTAVTPTDRPKSVSNCSVIKVFVLSRCSLDLFMVVGSFVKGLSQICSFFSNGNARSLTAKYNHFEEY